MSIGHKKLPIKNRGRLRSKRAKSFASEEAAKKWAESNKLSKYKVVQMQFGLSKKFKIVSSS